MAKEGTIEFLAKQGKTQFTVAWGMMRFTGRMEATPFGAIPQMTRSLVEMTRLKEIKEETPSMAAPAMIRSQGEMHRPTSFMAGMAMT